MPKKKTERITKTKDPNAAKNSVEKVLNTLGIKNYFTNVKYPSAGWLTTLDPTKDLEVVLEATDRLENGGTLSVKAKGKDTKGMDTYSTMATMRVEAARHQALIAALKKCGLA